MWINFNKRTFSVNMKNEKIKILIASVLILCSILLYILVEFTHLRISEKGTKILVFTMSMVWGITYFYILLKFLFKTKNKFTANLFRLFYYKSILLFTMTLPIINYCDGWQTRQDIGNSLYQYLHFIGIISGTYFLLLALLYFVNIIMTSLNYLKKKTKLKSVVTSIIIPLSGLFSIILFFITINSFGLNKNGRCDIITGPSDTSLSLILLVTIIINLIQYKTSTNNKVCEK